MPATSLPADLREALDAGAERTRRFAAMQREQLVDFEDEVVPGVVCGQRYVPVADVGAYLPAGRFPLLASAFMTVGVAAVAGVPNVIACTPPSLDGGPHPAVLYAAHASGADRVFALGGVQALAAMAFGLLDAAALPTCSSEPETPMWPRRSASCSAGSASTCSPGPSEVAVIADDTATTQMVAADLLGQAEHGPTSPACLVTTSERLAARSPGEIDRQLAALADPRDRRRGLAGLRVHLRRRLPRDRGRADGHAGPRAPRGPHRRPRLYLDNLHNYGSLFLGPVVDRRLRRQGHVRHQPRPADRPQAPASPAGSRSPASSSS